MAAVAFVRVLAAFVQGKAPALFLLESRALGFGVFFAAAFLLQVTGAVKRDGVQVIVNPWFAWIVIGGVVCFLVGLLARSQSLAADAPRIGFLSAGAWVGGVLLVWLTAKLASRGGA